jgi:translation initiation factor IF-2
LNDPVAKNMRLHELAKELGMTNQEVVDLCGVLGVPVKSHSSSLNEAYSDMVRRRAVRDGLTRDEQPEEPKVEKGPAKKGAARKADEPAPAPKVEAPAPAPEPAPVVEAPAATVAPAPAPVAPAPAPAAAAPAPAAAAPTPTPTPPPPAPAPTPEPVAEAPAPAPAEPAAAPAPPAEPTRPAPVSSAPAPAPAPAPTPAAAAEQAPERRPERPAAAAPSRPATPPPGQQAPRPAAASPAPATLPPRPASGDRVISSGRPVPGEQRPIDVPAARADAPVARQAPRPAPVPAGAPAGRPMSPSGRPIPPPPGRPLSPSGRPIPPPPGSARPSGPRPSGGPGGPRPSGGPGGPRPGGFAPRPGGPGGPGGARPGGGPGGPGGPRPGGGPGGPGGARPSGGRRPPRRGRSRRRRRDREELQPQYTNYTRSDAPVPDGTVVIERGVSAQEFGPKLNRTSADVIRFLLNNGEMITATMDLSDEQMELFALEIGADIMLVEPGQQEEIGLQALFDDSDDEADLEPRPPVVTIMGHVDHGKTTVLDKIRHANVVAGEAGGITQHIGAYMVEQNGGKITFLDTPGHAAFTQMRARGADATDIVVLVVAADDGVMPQTIEAINHAKAAEVPIIVAVNKIDKDNADPQRVLTQLAEHELVPESWGGDTIVVEMSATQELGIDDLLEQLLVVAELEELQANPHGRAKGVVLEAKLDVGRGPVATVLVDKGELKVGDPIVAGAAWGRVRAMINDKGEQVKTAGPSTPVQVLGLAAVPEAGDEFRAAPDEKTARIVGEARDYRLRMKHQRGDARVKTGTKLEDIFAQIQSGEAATLNLVLKADVHGSLEAVTESLRKLDRPEVELTFVHRAVGGITENDISLAATTNATIIGFNVRPDRKARELADAEDVEIRTYEIIYKLLEDIEQAMVGMLAPEFVEVVTGEAEVREIFRVPRVGAIAGCFVRSGVITRGSKVRFLRDGTIIWKGSISSLRRFKDDAREVREGFECGIGLSDFQDLKPGDLIETFEEQEVART